MSVFANTSIFYVFFLKKVHFLVLFCNKTFPGFGENPDALAFPAAFYAHPPIPQKSRILLNFPVVDWHSLCFSRKSCPCHKKKPPVRLFAERPSQKPIVKDIYSSVTMKHQLQNFDGINGCIRSLLVRCVALLCAFLTPSYTAISSPQNLEVDVSSLLHKQVA